MSVITVQQMADRVAGLMEDRLRIRGKTLQDKVRRGGRLLPRKVRREAEYLAEVAVLAQHPKVQTMLDDARIAEAYDVCLRHLRDIGAKERFWAMILSIAGSLALALLVLGGMFIAVLVWRGYL
jgi:hypothetical protein